MMLINLIVLTLSCVGVVNANLFEAIQKLSLGSIFAPEALSSLSDTNVSKVCLHQLSQFFNSTKKEAWAFQMFDAGTKFPMTGMSSGSFVDLGDFDLCMKVSNKKTIFGKYCIGILPLTMPDNEELSAENTKQHRLAMPNNINIPGFSKPSMLFATCLPASCSASDIQQFYQAISFPANFIESFCQSKYTKPQVTTGDRFAIAFFGVIILITLLSTTYDAINTYFCKGGNSLLNAFSLLTNVKKLLKVSDNTYSIACLSGIRTFSLMWIILAHGTSFQHSLATRNYLDRYKWLMDPKNQFLFGASVSVDTFFLLSGLLVSYNVMNSLSKGKRFNILAFYIHRVVRLTPALLVVILIYVTILKHVETGPFWNIAVGTLKDTCDKYWWSTILYIQNYVNVDEMCVSHSWYLAIDTQLYILSPLLLIPLYKRPKIGLLLASILTILVIITTFGISWSYNLYGYYLSNVFKTAYTFNHFYYHATHTRAAPWIIGVVLGYCIHKTQQKERKFVIPKLASLLFWIISLAILIACVFAGQSTLDVDYQYDRLSNAFYLALLRPGWALGLSWVIFACAMGYGGLVNWFLSLSVFHFFSKLTYTMYLVHFIILFAQNGHTRVIKFFNNFDTCYYFWGDFMFTFATALVLSLLFESPFMAIEKYLTSKSAKPTKPTIKSDDVYKSETPDNVISSL